MIEVLLNSLQLENYRGFKQYRLSGLARVNLLVGKNNCGKTSILEAVQILASQGDHRILASIAKRRGETIMHGAEQSVLHPDISHFFHGHHFDLGDRFGIANGDESVSLRMQVKSFFDLNEQEKPSHESLFHEIHPNYLRDISGDALGLHAIGIERRPHQTLPTFWLVSQEGALYFEKSQPGLFSTSKIRLAPIQFVSSELLGLGSMGRMWNQLISEGREHEIIQSLNILEPDLANIHFLFDDVPHRSDGSRVLVGFQDPKRKRVPLGSFGEGMRRMLALSLSLNQAQGGILLVDEIDTGLHYSILGDMWLLIVKAAIQYDLQVFATTHSLDCIRGLAWLCENHPELAGEVSVQKIDRRLDEAVGLDSDEIQIAVDQNLEVR